MIVCIYDYQQTIQKQKKTKMAETTEFIGGMDKIIAFIKSQGEKIKNLEDENKKLKEEHENYVMTHSCDMSCEECGLTTTEDDLQISLKHGSLICEECHDATNTALEIVKDENEVNKKNMMKFMKENKELKKQIEELNGTVDSLKDELEECNEYRNEYGDFYEPDVVDNLYEENKNLKMLVDLNEKKEKLHEEHIKELEKQMSISEAKRRSKEELREVRKQYVYFKQNQEPKLKARIAELEEKVTCLESDSHNEVSQAEYDDMKEQLEEKIKKLEDFHVAHLVDGELIDASDFIKLQEKYEDLEEQLRMSRLYEFFRMCEAYNGFHKNTNLYDQEWLNEMYVMFEERRDRSMPDTSELYKEYKEFIGYEPEQK